MLGPQQKKNHATYSQQVRKATEALLLGYKALA
jgi:hypothetical protein